MAPHLHGGVSVLRHTALGNVHAAHDLQAGNHHVLQIGGNGEHLVQQTVHAHPHHHFLCLRLQMDVAGPLVKGPLDEGVDKLDGGGGVALLLLPRGGPGRGINVHTYLALHFLHDLRRALIAVEPADGLLHCLAGGNHGNDSLPGGSLDLLLRHEVQRVAHGKVQRIRRRPHRHHAEAPGDVLRHEFRQLYRKRYLRQVNKFNAELNFQRVNQAFLRNEAILNQYIAQTLLCPLLQLHRLLQLFPGDGAGADQQVSQTHIGHIHTPRKYRHIAKRQTAALPQKKAAASLSCERLRSFRHYSFASLPFGRYAEYIHMPNGSVSVS